MNNVTTSQLKAIHAIINSRGLLAEKNNIISGFSGGRTVSSKELTCEEARALIMHFNNSPESKNKDNKGPMIKKMMNMAHQLGWITKASMVLPGGQVKQSQNYDQLYSWVTKYGYLKKDLKSYTYSELPKLVSQLEFGPYKSYIAGSKSQPEKDVF